MTKIRSPLRYPGGKSKAIKFIIPLIPEFDEYREPFLGGGSVFVHLKQKYPNKIFWINDIYENLYLFWKNAQQKPDLLIEQIEFWKNKFPEGKELYDYLTDNIENFDELKKAAAFFIFNRITFSGTSESGGYSSAAFHKRFTLSSIERVKQLSKILSNTIITNLDYKDVITAEGNNVFIFLDPPYYSATKSALYGKSGILHKTFNHEELAKTLMYIKHKWLITYDDCPFIRSLYSFANIKEWNLTYGMRNVGKNVNQKGNEIFISNFSLSNNTETLFNEYEKDLNTGQQIKFL